MTVTNTADLTSVEPHTGQTVAAGAPVVTVRR